METSNLFNLFKYFCDNSDTSYYAFLNFENQKVTGFFEKEYNYLIVIRERNNKFYLRFEIDSSEDFKNERFFNVLKEITVRKINDYYFEAPF